jgi:hypothetical protein
VWSSLEHEEFRDAVRKAELFADDLVDRDEMLQAYEKARAIFAKLHGKDNGPGAALTASGFPSPPKSFLQRVADASTIHGGKTNSTRAILSRPPSSRRGTRHGQQRIYRARGMSSMPPPRSPSIGSRLSSSAVSSEIRSACDRCAPPG